MSSKNDNPKSNKVSRAISFNVMQHADIDYWPKDYHDGIIQCDAKIVGEVMMRRLAKNKIPVSRGYIVLHNQYYGNDGEIVIDDDEYCHYHALFQLENRTSLSKVAKALGLSNDWVRPMSKEDYSFDNCLSYLIHYKDPDKIIYDPNEVTTLKGTDYLVEFERNEESWLIGRSKKQRMLEKERKELDKNRSKVSVSSPYADYDIDDMLEGINRGEIDRTTVISDPHLLMLYELHPNPVDMAFNFEECELAQPSHKRADKVRNEIYHDKRYRPIVIFLSGDPGTGKTETLIKLINDLTEITNELTSVPWRDFAGSHLRDYLDGYKDEEIIVLDDVSGGSMYIEEITEILGNKLNSMVGIRYHNRKNVAKFISLISNQSHTEFYDDLQNYSITVKRPWAFYRRFQCILEVEEITANDDGEPESLVRLSTYVDDYKKLIEKCVPNVVFNEAVDSPSGFKRYICSTLFTMDQIREILLRFISGSVIEPMITNPDTMHLIGLAKKEASENERLKVIMDSRDKESVSNYELPDMTVCTNAN